MTDNPVERLFHKALAQKPADRDRFLFESCRGDWVLYREVRDLILFHEDSDPIIDIRPDSSELVLETMQRNVSPVLSPGSEVKSGLGRYRIVELAGEGGMGLVYFADQLEPVRRPVALKVVKFAMDSKRVKSRFESERQALALMNHPNIARVFEAGATDSGRPFFAMEYVNGPAITRYCDEARLSVRERIELFLQVCKGVQHAHQKGIIHRDIKPTNVLVDKEGDVPTPKIIDFGVAKATGQRLVERTLFTHAGTIVGSVLYISPEQVDPRITDIDTRTDVYSLGVLLYELLVGSHPLGIESPEKSGYAEIERRIRETDPELPSCQVAGLGEAAVAIARRRSTDARALVKTLRGELDWILTKALEKQRERRYQSASEFAADLRNYLDGEPVLAAPVNVSYRLSKIVRRNRTLVAGVSAVIVALSVGLLVNLGLLVSNDRTARLVYEQREDIRRLGDVKRLESLLKRADDLAPPHPEMVSAMEVWLDEARALASRSPDHRRTLREIQNRARVSEAGVGTTIAVDRVVFEDAKDEFQYQVVSTLVKDMDRFLDPKTGTVPDVERRLDFARSVYSESIESRLAEWKAAINAIADTTVCPQYKGLRLTPQIGLVPIGRDPVSGLWEFAHLYGGRLPERSDDGRLEINEETGVVMVLVPPGCFHMGATDSVIAGLPAQIGDRFARDDEEPPHRVCLDAFFVSKYLMTQAQWLRLRGENPSMFPTKPTCQGTWRPLLHPVENVTWDHALQATRMMGLVLPTEAQWEYAGRAGTVAPRWTGWEPAEMEGYGNFDDLCRREMEQSSNLTDVEWNDGYGETSPVDNYKPNGFGLHDVLGNIYQWCRDNYGSYQLPVAPGDGLRLVEKNDQRVMRGSDFQHVARASRISWRGNMFPESRVRIGVRPARSVTYSLP